MELGKGECRAHGRVVDGSRHVGCRSLPCAGSGRVSAAGGGMAGRLGRLGGDCESALLFRGDTDGLRPDGQEDQDGTPLCEDGVSGGLGVVLRGCVRLVLWISVPNVRRGTRHGDGSGEIGL